MRKLRTGRESRKEKERVRQGGRKKRRRVGNGERRGESDE